MVYATPLTPPLRPLPETTVHRSASLSSYVIIALQPRTVANELSPGPLFESQGARSAGRTFISPSIPDVDFPG